MLKNFSKNSIHRNENWLHIGPGNFHKSHQAYYAQLSNKFNKSKVSILGLEINKKMKIDTNLKKQNFKYSLLTRGKKTKYFKIESISKIIKANQKNLNYIKKKFQNNELDLITLTVTENGYFNNDNQIDLNNKLIKKDIKFNQVNTVYGLFFKFLIYLKKSKKKIFVISCDNLDNNSKNFKKNFKLFLSKKNKRLVKQVNKKFSFLNSMVDRITPKQNNRLNAEIFKKFKIKEKYAIESEDYCNWIIENKNKYIIKNYKLKNVKFVKKIKNYQHMKLMMLNASHCSTSFLAYLNGNSYVRDTFNNRYFLKFINKYLDKDVIPYLEKNFYDYKKFKKEIITRFSNKFLKDKTARTVENGSTNLGVFIKPSLVNCLKNKADLKRFSLIYASWFVFIQKNKSHNWKELKDTNKKEIINLTNLQNRSNVLSKYNKLINLSLVDKNDEFNKNLEYYINLLKHNKIEKALTHASK